jgi:hypothetical protein
LRTFNGTFTTLDIPRSVVEISVRYTDPYDVQRASNWTTLKLPSARTNFGKDQRER